MPSGPRFSQISFLVSGVLGWAGSQREMLERSRVMEDEAEAEEILTEWWDRCLSFYWRDKRKDVGQPWTPTTSAMYPHHAEHVRCVARHRRAAAAADGKDNDDADGSFLDDPVIFASRPLSAYDYPCPALMTMSAEHPSHPWLPGCSIPSEDGPLTLLSGTARGRIRVTPDAFLPCAGGYSIAAYRLGLIQRPKCHVLTTEVSLAFAVHGSGNGQRLLHFVEGIDASAVTGAPSPRPTTCFVCDRKCCFGLTSYVKGMLNVFQPPVDDEGLGGMSEQTFDRVTQAAFLCGSEMELRGFSNAYEHARRRSLAYGGGARDGVGPRGTNRPGLDTESGRKRKTDDASALLSRSEAPRT